MSTSCQPVTLRLRAKSGVVLLPLVGQIGATPTIVDFRAKSVRDVKRLRAVISRCIALGQLEVVKSPEVGRQTNISVSPPPNLSKPKRGRRRGQT